MDRGDRKNLITIYITHGHGDHFFGLNPILSAFPEARAVTAAAVLPETQGQLSRDYLQFWTTTFPGQIPAHLAVPSTLDGDVIDLEGHQLRIIPVAQAEALDPRIVVAGHKRPDAPDDDPTAILGGTKAYLRDFERSLAGSHSAQGLVDKMMAVRGDLGNPYTLWTAA
jgi:Metallo-beta-lactamase superfamily